MGRAAPAPRRSSWPGWSTAATSTEQVRLDRRRRHAAPRPGGAPGRRRQRRGRREGAARRLPRRHRRPTTPTSAPATCAGTPASCAAHVDTLSAKAYWRALPETPEFVVLFVPGRVVPVGRARGRARPARAYAADADVVLATPTTLIALLRTVAHGWTHEALAERTREIHAARPRAARPARRDGRPPRQGRPVAASGAVEAYNSAVGSLESRVLVAARRFERPRRHRRRRSPRCSRWPSPRGRSPRPSCSRRWPSSAPSCPACPTARRRRVAPISA